MELSCLELNFERVRWKEQQQRMEGSPAFGTPSHMQVRPPIRHDDMFGTLADRQVQNMALRYVHMLTGYSYDGSTADVSADQYHHYKVITLIMHSTKTDECCTVV